MKKILAFAVVLSLTGLVGCGSSSTTAPIPPGSPSKSPEVGSTPKKVDHTDPKKVEPEPKKVEPEPKKVEPETKKVEPDPKKGK
jgi:hypothetical protein